MESITKSGEMEHVPLPIPGTASEKLFVKRFTLATKYGPVVAELKREAGACISARIHHKTEERHYVAEGDFINKGITYGAGTFFCYGIGQVHGPHSTTTGCRLLFIQPARANPSDFEIASLSGQQQ